MRQNRPHDLSIKAKTKPLRKRKRLQTRRVGAPTLDHVASRAGVSTATVSRCLNTPSAVRPAMRAKVERAIHELGYVPHGAARALASHRTHTIGAVIPTIDNAIFSKGLQALQHRVGSSGYTMLLATSEYDIEREREQVEALVSRGVDGMVLVGQLHAPQVHELLLDKTFPMFTPGCLMSRAIILASASTIGKRPGGSPPICSRSVTETSA